MLRKTTLRFFSSTTPAIKKLAGYPDDLLKRLSATPLRWTISGDPSHPYQTNVEGIVIKLRLGDFPEEPMYTPVIDGVPITLAEEINEFPPHWERPIMS